MANDNFSSFLVQQANAEVPKIEAELAQLDAEERAEFLETLGLEEAGLDRLIHAGYELLNLITFFNNLTGMIDRSM